MLGAFLLFGFPFALFVEIHVLNERGLLLEARNLTLALTDVHRYYSEQVVARIKSADSAITVTQDYHDRPGAIPIPATLSLELVEWLKRDRGNFRYAFGSDLRFPNSIGQPLDEIDLDALRQFRAKPSLQELIENRHNLGVDTVRLITPIRMNEGCVACHNSTEQSPKKNWQVGDIRGIQSIEVSRSLVDQSGGLSVLIGYFLICLCVTAGYLVSLRRSTTVLGAALHRAEEADRVKTMFLANMSHELRTPLNAILGFSEVIRDQIFEPIPSRYRDYAASIHTGGRHLLDLIDDLLDLSKITEGKYELHEEEVLVARVMETIAALMRRQFETAGVTLVCDSTLASDQRVRADPRALKQIGLNLLSNALKFSPSGSTVVLSLSRRVNGDLSFTVADEGPGIAESELRFLFEPFRQIHRSLEANPGGTGLGLWIVDGLVRLHQGAVEVKTKLGEGAAFTVVLPAVRVIAPTKGATT